MRCIGQDDRSLLSSAMVSQITTSRDLSESSCSVSLFISAAAMCRDKTRCSSCGDVPAYVAETHMLQAVWRPTLGNRRAAIAKLWRAGLADRVTTILAELR